MVRIIEKSCVNETQENSQYQKFSGTLPQYVRYFNIEKYPRPNLYTRAKKKYNK